MNRSIRGALDLIRRLGPHLPGRPWWRRRVPAGPTSEAPGPAVERVVDFYAWVLGQPFGDGEAPGSESRTLNWVIPDFRAGYGGHTTIFRLIYLLEALGYRSRVMIDGPCHFASGEEAREAVRRHFFPLQAEMVIGRGALGPAWATIATSWPTAYTVRDFRPTRVRCYLVQDFEPAFHPVGSDYHFAEQTYRLGLHGITAGDWLAKRVREDYGMGADAFHFGVDRKIYRPLPQGREARRVFFYARPVTPRRGFELGMLALAILCERMPEVEVLLAGGDLSRHEIPFRHVILGTVSPRTLAGAMASCQAALILSLTNLSLLPLEAMACGCLVVSNAGPQVEWLLQDGENAILCEPAPEALAAGLERALKDAEQAGRLRRSASAFAAAKDWRDAGAEVAALFARLAEA